MKIYIIGKTESFALYDMMTLPGRAGNSKFEDRILDEVISGQHVIEFAGRLCYESWDLPNEGTATNDKYIRNIVKQGHESVLEHVSVTFYVEGVSRNLSHELIRHRHLSFSELSQRFVDMSDANFVVPPIFRNEAGGVGPLCHITDYPSEFGGPEGNPLVMYSEMVEQAQDGWGAVKATRKQAREGARSYLPAGMETKFVVTGNLRAWRDVLKKRDSEHADAEMQLFAKEIKRQLLNEYPDVFADLDEDS
jgi:thymidylate synthase (FAD)